MEKCIIVGAGTYGQVYYEYLKELYEVIGFIDDNVNIHGSKIKNVSVLGDFNFLLDNIDRDVAVFVPIGNNSVRVSLLKRLQELGFVTPNYIDSSSNIHSSVCLGKAVYILGGTNIMPLAIIGDYVMISMGVNVAHHSSIQDGCFLSQGTNIGASIKLERNVFIGISATVMTGVELVGEGALIGAGALVLKNVNDYNVIVGNPGRFIRFNK